MDIIAKFVQKQTRKIREYTKFTVDTGIGELEITLKDYCIPHAGFRYSIEVNKGATSEFKPFVTRFFADRHFEKLKKKYGGDFSVKWTAKKRKEE